MPKELIVKLHGYDYEVEVIDSTHIKMREKGRFKWGTALHFGQVQDEVLKQLEKLGAVEHRHFVESKLKTLKSRVEKLEALIQSLIFSADDIDLDKLKKSVKAPYVVTQLSTLGGKENASITIHLSLDPEKNWQNGIFHNSRYSIFHIYRNGEVEQSSKGTANRFRKARAKSLDDAVAKINKYLQAEEK